MNRVGRIRTVATVLFLATSAASAPALGQSADRLLVVNKSGNTISIIDPVSRAEVAVVPTGFAPHEVAAAPGGRLAYVSDYGTGERPGTSVTVVDLRAAAAVGKIPLDPHTRPHGVAVAGDGTVWVTTEGSGHVLQLDPEAGTVLHAVATGQPTSHMLVVAARRGRVYVTNIGSGSVTAVDAVAHTVLAQITTGAGAEGIDVAPDGDHVYVTNRSAGTLSEIAVESNRVTRTLQVGDYPIRVKVRPDGKEALVSNARGNEIVAVDLARWEVVRHLAVGAMPVGILIAPDNRTAYVANTRDDKVSVIDLVGWKLDGEIIAGDEPDGMAWVEGRSESRE